MQRVAFFLDGGAGRIFCTGYLHGQPSGRRQRILIVPPFAEELNKSRHVLAAIARKAAEAGCDVLLPDLYGTGDSEGDFGDASIDTWRVDLDAAIARFPGDGPLHLVALRAGALLAMDLATRHPLCRLTLLHPQTDGKQLLVQFLRLRLAANLVSGDKETTAQLRQRLRDGESLEVAGYRLRDTLAGGLETLNLSAAPPRGVGVDWVELAPDGNRPVMPGSQRVIDAWQAAGTSVQARVIACDLFWATQEIAACPQLVETVDACLAMQAPC